MSRKSTKEGRPETVVVVWARSVHSGERGRRSSFFRREWVRRFPGISAWGLILFSCVRTILRVFFTEHSGRQLTNVLRWEHRRQTQATTAAAVQTASSSYATMHQETTIKDRPKSAKNRPKKSLISGNMINIFHVLLIARCHPHNGLRVWTRHVVRRSTFQNRTLSYHVYSERKRPQDLYFRPHLRQVLDNLKSE